MSGGGPTSCQVPGIDLKKHATHDTQEEGWTYLGPASTKWFKKSSLNLSVLHRTEIEI